MEFDKRIAVFLDVVGDDVTDFLKNWFKGYENVNSLGFRGKDGIYVILGDEYRSYVDFLYNHNEEEHLTNMGYTVKKVSELISDSIKYNTDGSLIVPEGYKVDDAEKLWKFAKDEGLLKRTIKPLNDMVHDFLEKNNIEPSAYASMSEKMQCIIKAYAISEEFSDDNVLDLSEDYCHIIGYDFDNKKYGHTILPKGYGYISPLFRTKQDAKDACELLGYKNIKTAIL